MEREYVLYYITHTLSLSLYLSLALSLSIYIYIERERDIICNSVGVFFFWLGIAVPFDSFQGLRMFLVFYVFMIFFLYISL